MAEVLATYTYTLIDSGTHYEVVCSNKSTCTQAVIPSTYNGKAVTSIGSDAFNGCSSLTSITIPNSVTSIGYAAFSGCSSLTSVTIGNSVTSIGSYAFSDCRKLTKVNYTGDINSWAQIKFGGSAANPLYYAHNLYINDKLVTEANITTATKISGFAFCYCSITSVTIGNSITSISSSAFRNCSSLTSVTIGNSVTSIGEYAFSGCSALTSIEIPDSVTSIGSYAFSGCSSLTSVTIKATIPPTLGTNVFQSTGECSIYVPAQSIDAYKTALNWSAYASRIQAIPVPRVALDLSTLQGWAALSDGPHTITIKAKAPGYRDSDSSAGVTVIKGPAKSYTLTKSGITSYGWTTSSKPNPDSSLYDGVYESTNQGVNSSYGVMRIDFTGYDEFVVYIRSYAESNYDYTIASTLDATSYPTAYSDSTAKAHTRGNQQSGTALSSYTKVSYPNDGGDHHIFIVYRKDSSAASGDDKGYVFIQK